MTQRLVIIGAGGFGREAADIIDAVNFEYLTTDEPKFDVLGFLDDGDPDLGLLEPYGLPHLGPVSTLDELPADVGYVIAIGNPAVKRKVDEQGGGRSCPVLVHPSASMGRRVELGPGTIVCAGSRLTNHIRLGRHVHVNLNCTIGHDATLADYVTLSPLVAVSGGVVLEDEVMIGTGVTLNPLVTVGTGSVIGSGAAVLRDVPPGVTAVGVPAKVRGG